MKMKTSAKLLPVLMIAVMALSLFGCSSKADISELKKNKGMMLVKMEAGKL